MADIVNGSTVFSCGRPRWAWHLFRLTLFIGSTGVLVSLQLFPVTL